MKWMPCHCSSGIRGIKPLGKRVTSGHITLQPHWFVYDNSVCSGGFCASCDFPWWTRFKTMTLRKVLKQREVYFHTAPQSSNCFLFRLHVVLVARRPGSAEELCSSLRRAHLLTSPCVTEISINQLLFLNERERFPDLHVSVSFCFFSKIILILLGARIIFIGE